MKVRRSLGSAVVALAATMLSLMLFAHTTTAAGCGWNPPAAWQDIYYVGAFPNHRCIVGGEHYNYLGYTGTSKSNSYAGSDLPSVNCTYTSAQAVVAFGGAYAISARKNDTTFDGQAGPAAFVPGNWYIFVTNTWAVRPGLFDKKYISTVYC